MALFARRAYDLEHDYDDRHYYLQLVIRLQRRQAELKRYIALEHQLHDQRSQEWWSIWQEHHALPFPGSWLEQPAWVQDDFNYLDLLEEYHKLPYQIEEARKNGMKQRGVT